MVKRHQELFTCVLSFHYAIMDGWSAQCLVRFVNQHYLQTLSMRAVEADPDHSYFTAQKMLEAESRKNVQFWERALENIAATAGLLESLPIKVQNETARPFILQDAQLSIQGDLLHALRETCKQEGLTLHSILQFAWHRTLYAYCNASQTVIGTIVSGRNLPIAGIEDSVGLYINTLPLAVDHEADPNMSIRELIGKIQDSMMDISNHSGINL